MKNRLRRFVVTLAFAAGVLPPARAADIALERPSTGSPGAEALHAELEHVEAKLGPHSVLWLEPGERVPPGYWGLTGWSLTDSSDQLQLEAKFARPGSTGEPLPKIATCFGRLGTDREHNKEILENCIHDLLNQTFFDPQDGFVGYVRAPLCKFEAGYDYRFSRVSLAASGIEPGLTKMKTKQWPTIRLAMENPHGADEPFLFEDAAAGYEGPFASLKALGEKSVLLTTPYAYPKESTDYLNYKACSGTAVPDRKLRIYLDRTPTERSIFGLQDRTSSPTGGS